MKIYIVFEDVSEAYEFHFERLFIEAYLKEDDAKEKVKELSRGYNDVYYEEIELK